MGTRRETVYRVDRIELVASADEHGCNFDIGRTPASLKQAAELLAFRAKRNPDASVGILRLNIRNEETGQVCTADLSTKDDVLSLTILA